MVMSKTEFLQPPTHISSQPDQLSMSTFPFSVRPLYLQVYDKLTALIADNSWKPGTMIANEVNLARDLGVSVGTVRKALQLMVERRLLIRRQGRGTFVADQDASGESVFESLRDRTSGGMRWAIEVIDVAIKDPSEVEQDALEIRRGRSVLRRHRRLRDEGSGTVMLETSSLSQDQFPQLSVNDAVHALPIHQLSQAHGMILGSFEETVRPIALDANQARDLRSDPGRSALEMTRIAFTLDHLPLEWRSCVCLLGPSTEYLHRFE